MKCPQLHARDLDGPKDGLQRACRPCMASPEPLPAGLPVFQRVLLPRYTQGYPLLDASHPQLSCGHCWMLLCVIFSSAPLLGRCSSFLRLQLTAQTKHTDRHTDSSCKPPFPTDSLLSFPTVPSITHTHTHISPRAHAPPSRVQGSREKPKPVSLQTFHLLPVPNFIVAQQPSSLVWRPTSSPFPWVRVPPLPWLASKPGGRARLAWPYLEHWLRLVKRRDEPAIDVTARSSQAKP